MVLKSRADLIKKPTPPPRLFSLLVCTKAKSSGVNSFRNEGVSGALIWVSVRPKTSKFPVLTSFTKSWAFIPNGLAVSESKLH